MIPKVIHYCWFGRNPKPELIEKCIASWHQYCPDYEIVEWNEDNYDISKSRFMQEAYDAKKWAFVSDYARLDIIAENGGIYLDTDVELSSSLDDLIQYDAFFAFETAININSGQCVGAAKGHKSVRACLEPYLNKHFFVNGKPDLTPCPLSNTTALINAYPSLIRNGQDQLIDNVLFLSCNAYAERMKHHGTGTWIDGYRKRHVYRYGVIKEKLLRSPKVFDWIEKHLGKRAVDLYTFCVYDLIEMGPMYFILRKLHK